MTMKLEKMMPGRQPFPAPNTVPAVSGQMVPGNRQIVSPATGNANPAMMVRPQGGGNFVQRPTAPQQQASAPTHPQEQLDPILRAKDILPHLKEALVNLMAVASQNFAVSVAVDDMQKVVDSSGIPRFDKCLEHFFSLCDQIEMQLMTAHRQLSQTLISAHHAPLLRTMNIKSDPQLYSSYMTTIDYQLQTAKEIYNLLSNCCKKLTEHQTSLPLCPT